MFVVIDGREWKITLNGEQVYSMFDKDGEITFSPVDAVDANVAATPNDFTSIGVGDSFTYALVG